MKKSVIINGVEVKVGMKIDFVPEGHPDHKYWGSEIHTVTKVMPKNLCFDMSTKRVSISHVAFQLRTNWWKVVD